LIDPADHLGLARVAAGRWLSQSVTARRLGMDWLFAEASYALLVACRQVRDGDDRPFGPYATAIIHRHLRHALAKERLRGLHAKGTGAMKGYKPPAPSWGGLRDRAGRGGAELADWLDGLPAAERETLRHLYQGGLTLREAGEAMGRSHESVRLDERRALKRLRRQLEAA
jgi:DNA-directed RNA polymerase specialized sigma24 family protein